jgi:hypothetical protein
MLIKDIYKCTWYGKKITESKYSEILNLLHNRPAAPEGHAYKLTESLEWELYELPAIKDESIEEVG